MAEAKEAVRLSLENVALFAEECILFVLRWHNLDWSPPLSRQALASYSQFNLFTVEIGKALAHNCIVIESRLVAERIDFNIPEWLEMEVDDARNYVSRRFFDYTFILPARMQFKHLLLWTYACFLCRQAVIFEREVLISDVLAQLVIIMYSNYKNLEHYENLNALATLYNRIHSDLHTDLGDEGYPEA